MRRRKASSASGASSRTAASAMLGGYDESSGSLNQTEESMGCPERSENSSQ
ncbi:hypothetical protein OG458_05515 [Streptomyces sp. NBC_01281]|nr:hypothetical protein OG458_05515 [Streptomyces sp. NBC_01281]